MAKRKTFEAPWRVVGVNHPGDFVGTRVLHLDCGHTLVRKASAPVPGRARCLWCGISKRHQVVSRLPIAGRIRPARKETK